MPVFAACTAIGTSLQIDPTSPGQYPVAEDSHVSLTGLAGSSVILVSSGISDPDTIFPPIALTITNRAVIDVAGGDGIDIMDRGDPEFAFGDVCYDGAADASISTDANGVVISTSGLGDVSLTVDHPITAGDKAIHISHSGVGAISIDAAGSLSGEFGGIVAQQMGAGDVTITARNITASSGTGIAVTQLSEYQTTIIVGDITAAKGIYAYTAGSISIALTGTLKSTDTGIELRGPGAADVTISGTIDAPQTAILFASSENRLTLEPGYSIGGRVDAPDPLDPDTGERVPTLDDTLVFGGTGSGRFDISKIGDQYVGFDIFRKTGSSIWTFEGVATNPITLEADDGTIKIDAQTSGLDVILTGTATIGGVGRINSLSLTGGTLAPGNSIGTLNVTGDAIIGAGTTYRVEVDPTNGIDGFGHSDRLVVGQTATIGADVKVEVILADGNYLPKTTYTILTGGSILGSFVQPPTVIDRPLMKATLRPDDTTNPTIIYLDLERSDATVADQGQTTNQQQQGASIDSAGAAAPHLDQILVLLAPEIPSALNALSGDGYASIITAAIDGGNHLRTAAFERRDASGPWTRPYGRFATLASDGNGPAVNTGAGGVDIGIDEVIGHNQIGVLIGYGETSFALPSRDMAATAAEFSLGAHGSIWWDDTYLSLGAAATGRRMTVTRKVIFTGVRDSYTSSFSGLTLEGFGELGHSFRFAETRLTPFGGLAAIESLSSGFTESGAGPAPLTIAANGTAALVTTLGVRIEHKIMIADRLPILLSASAAWQHSFGGTAALSNRLANGPAFTVTGAPLPANTLLFNAGAQLTLSPSLSLALAYAGTLASHGLSATLAGQMM
ncbi:MAG: autotransporter domain-containing protein [Devosia sp.]